jgi:hypothetical protein
MCSNRSIKPGKTWRDEYGEGRAFVFVLKIFLINCFLILADILLNVKSMRQTAALIGTQITMYEIENAKHDIFLSKESVREKAFDLMFRWLGHLEEDWIIKTKI